MKPKLSAVVAAVTAAVLSLSLSSGSVRADVIRFVAQGIDGETVFDFGNVVVGTTVTLPFSFTWEDGTDGDYRMVHFWRTGAMVRLRGKTPSASASQVSLAYACLI